MANHTIYILVWGLIHMQEMARERFNFSYESSAAASHLVISMDASEKVLEYHVEMVANNAIPHIINFDLRRMDSKICFYYDVTSKLVLSQFLKRSRVSRNEFLMILSDISKTLVGCKNYLLSDKCFLLDTDYMYINPSTMEISMIYVPIAFDTDINSEFREFATNLILYSVNIDDSNDNYLQRVLYYLKAEPFNIFEFYKSINMLMIGYGHSAAGECSCSTDSEKAGKDVQDKQLQKDKEKDKESEPAAGKKHGFFIPQPKDQGEEKKKVEKGGPAELKLKPRRAVLLTQLIIAAVLILIPVYLKLPDKNSIINYGGVVLIVVALDILVLKVLFGKKEISRAEKSDNKKGRLTVQKTANSKVSGVICNVNIPEKTTPAEGRISNDTVILGPSFKEYPFLKGSNNGVFEIIEITRPDFLIGRLKEHVDYTCANSAIGKVHAQIIKRDGLYFIKDMNSRNGTYLNNARIDPGKEYEIKNNDRITLANSEYTFVIPEMPEDSREGNHFT